MALLKKLTKSLKTAKRSQKKSSPAKKPSSRLFSDEMRQLIEKKAYELYEARGRQPGLDLADWFQAESIVRTGRK